MRITKRILGLVVLSAISLSALYPQLDLNQYRVIRITPDKEYWSSWVPDDNASGVKAPAGYFLAGIQIEGKETTRQRYYFRTSSLVQQVGMTSTRLSWLREAQAAGCRVPAGHLISGVETRENDTGEILVHSTEAGPAQWDNSRAKWVEWYTGGKETNIYIAPAGFFIVGWQDAGGNGGGNQFLIAPLKL